MEVSNSARRLLTSLHYANSQIQTGALHPTRNPMEKISWIALRRHTSQSVCTNLARIHDQMQRPGWERHDKPNGIKIQASGRPAARPETKCQALCRLQ